MELEYLTLKLVHAGSAVLSIAGFIARGLLKLRQSPLLATRFVRIAPHVVDTLLLASGLWLAWRIGQFPFVQGWLSAKVLALVAYIALGAVALKHGRTKRVRATAFALALCAVFYIVSVAWTRDPLGLLILLR